MFCAFKFYTGAKDFYHWCILHKGYIHRTVQLNLINLTCACTTLASFPPIFARYLLALCMSFHFTYDCTKVIQLLLDLFTNKFSKCHSCHEHKDKSLKTLLNTTLTYVHVVHVNFVQSAHSSIKNS